MKDWKIHPVGLQCNKKELSIVMGDSSLLGLRKVIENKKMDEFKRTQKLDSLKKVSGDEDVPIVVKEVVTDNKEMDEPKETLKLDNSKKLSGEDLSVVNKDLVTETIKNTTMPVEKEIGEEEVHNGLEKVVFEEKDMDEFKETHNLGSPKKVSGEDVPIVVKDMVTETIKTSNSVREKTNVDNLKEICEDSEEEEIDIFKLLFPSEEDLRLSDDSLEEPINTSPKKQQVLALPLSDDSIEETINTSPKKQEVLTLPLNDDSIEEPIITSPKKQEVLASNFESSVQNASPLSTDENKRPSSTKELLKESISLPYHEENNNSLHEFADIATSHAADDNEVRIIKVKKITPSDKQKTLDNNKIVLMNRERFRRYKLLNQASNSIKKTPVSNRDSYKQNLKEKMQKKKEEYFDKLKKIEQADEEMIEAEEAEILEADDEEEDLDSDCFSPTKKLISPIKILKGKKIAPSSDTRKSSEHQFQPAQEHSVLPSCSYQQPKLLQGSQHFSSQESVDINMICSGRFPDSKTNGQSQGMPWSPPSQREVIANESDEDVVFICEQTCPSSASNSKTASKSSFQQEDSSDGKEYETKNEETNSFKRKRACPSSASNSKKASKSSTQQEDSSDGEGIKSCAKKCRVLTYLSEEESESDNSIPENSFVSPNIQRESFESNSDKSLIMKNKNEFLDLEAQLDSNEEATSDESESELTEEIKDLIDDEKESDVNHEELALIHHKKTLEEDARVVKHIQEKYLPGGDLHDDGKGRQKKFLWNKNEGSTIPMEIILSDSEQEDVAEASVSQEKAIWRQKSTMVQKSDSDTENQNFNETTTIKLPIQIVGKDSNSQIVGTPAYKATSSTTPKIRRSGSFMALRKNHKSSQVTPNAGLTKNLFISNEKNSNQQVEK